MNKNKTPKTELFEDSIIREIESQYKKLQNNECKKREYQEKLAEGRSEYARDYARILYSSAFRRLQGKMQILGIESTAFYRNRLTHSLEVSQIARSIAKTVSLKCGKEKEMYTEEELYLLDAAALAHDIGHSAFGHKGERVLDEIANRYGLRFESNAQNFRVLRKLDRHGSSKKGLNLTYRTLLAINKYICDEKENNPKKFMYNNDFIFLAEFRKENKITQHTLDVQIIEIADDIAYAVHDLEDGLAQKVFTIDEINSGISYFKDNTGKIKDEDRDNASQRFEEIIKEIKQHLISNKDSNTIQEYSHLFRKQLISKLTNEFVTSIVFDKDKLCMNSTHAALCYILSKIIYQAATQNSLITLYELKGEIIIKSLFAIYMNNNSLLPPDYRPEEQNSICQKARYVIDYIAGMMDTYAISEFEHFTGIAYKDIDLTKSTDIKKKIY